VAEDDDVVVAEAEEEVMAESERIESGAGSSASNAASHCRLDSPRMVKATF
jgi:hypothetical protein